MNGQAERWGKGGELSFIVVGGGLGSHTAWELARRGFYVRLYERNPNRHVVCGGLVNSRTVERFPFLKEFAVHRVDGALIGAGEEEVYIGRRGVAYVLDRDVMFRGMLERAASEGVEVVYKPWKGERGGLLLAADGALSSFRPLVTEARPTFILGAQTLIPWEEDDHVRVDFGPWSDVFFGWVIPLGDGRAKAGIGLSQQKWTLSRPLLRRYLSFLGVRGEGFEARLIPLGPPLPRIRKGDVVLLGDAGLFVKASTGGGISYGLSWSKRLVEAVVSGEDVNAAYRREFYPSLLIHWLVHRLYNRVPPKAIIRAVKEGYGEYIKKKGDMDSVDWMFSLETLKFSVRIAFHAFYTLLGLS